MPRFTLKIVLGAASLGAALFLLVSFFLSPPEVKIFFDGSVYTPSEISVRPGTKIVFYNQSDVAMWPAADLHPSHTTYSAFDPKEPVAPGESWSFIIEIPGRWSFHDHLQPNIHGFVTVEQIFTAYEVVTECVEDCWKQTIVSVLQDQGVAAAFEQFAYMYEHTPGFRSVCHDVAHTIGEAAFEKFDAGEPFFLTESTSYCGYGFYHGFMETLLVTGGNFDEARAFCDYVSAQMESYGTAANIACYHGIGHGFTDGSDPRTWGNAEAVVQKALEMCSQIALNAFDKHICGTGVYNGLAIARRDEQFGLNASLENVFAPCESITDIDFKPSCYEQMNTLVVSLVGYKAPLLFSSLQKIPEPIYLPIALRSAINVLVKDIEDSNEVADITKVCLTTFTDQPVSCVGGVIDSVIEFGTPGKRGEEVIALCESAKFNDSERKICFAEAAAVTGRKLSSAQSAVCDRYYESTGQQLTNCLKP